jgi:NADH-quinone oxidoreductase subunit D
MSPNTLLDNAPLNDSPLEEHRHTSYNQPTTPITDSTGATLAGFRPAEDLIIPGVEDVVEESTSHHHPRGTDAVSSSTMVLNMGPQHPSTHGVLRLVLEVDGETVISLAPDIGYLHTGIEKTCEAKFYSQVTPMTDRIDYLCPMTNNTAYALAVEKLLGLEIPERAQYLRVLLNELTRIQSHLVWLGTHAMDIGALTVFLYCFREREDLLRIFEAISGQRMMSSYIRIGGVALEPPADIYEKIRSFLNSFPKHIEEYEGLLNANPIWMGRLKGIGHLSAEDAIALGVTGPPLRASGVDFDVRRDMPYSSYEKFSFAVPVSNGCDVWARYLVRMEEMRESTKICHQALDLLATLHDTRLNADAPKIVLPDREQMKTQMESLIHHFKIVTEGFQVPAGEATSSVEAPHGMMNYYVVSDGTAKPYRVHMRNADFATLQALETMCKGRLIADVVAVIGSIDIVLGAIDR